MVLAICLLYQRQIQKQIGSGPGVCGLGSEQRWKPIERRMNRIPCHYLTLYLVEKEPGRRLTQLTNYLTIRSQVFFVGDPANPYYVETNSLTRVPGKEI